MSARTKLNVAAVHGAIVVAALVGWAFGSWLAFVLALAVLLATGFHSRAIRLARPRR